jgi:hypothetical protein
VTASGNSSAVGLARKLGVTPGAIVALHRAPEGWTLGGMPAGARTRAGLRGGAELVIAFVRRASELEPLAEQLAAAVGPTDAVWVAWPRRAAGHRSDVTDGVVRGTLLAHGLVDVKVAALGEDWSGLRFVWPLDRRATMARRRASGSGRVEGEAPATRSQHQRRPTQGARKGGR